MRLNRALYLASISMAATCLPYWPVHDGNLLFASQTVAADAPSQQVDEERLPDRRRNVFLDRTQEITREALMLVDRNQREGAPRDQRWYAFRRFGEHLEEILRTKEIRFYGGRETDVLRAIADQYISVTPIEPNQDAGEIRLFLARRDNQNADLVIIGQNGKEVALKTVIRLAYILKFKNGNTPHAFNRGLDSFLPKVKIYLSTIPPRQEFISFFRRYRIADPDAVIIGFERDSRAVLRNSSMDEPELYSDDSLRINWYRGKKVLLVSINGNRIFASRAGGLIEAMVENFHSPPRSLIFFGSAGAIDSADLVGQIVAPTVVINNDSDSSARHKESTARIIDNRAAMMLPIKTAHVSVASLAMETMSWAKENKHHRISTVDQELCHVIDAFDASPYAGKVRLFVSVLVTDNVSSVWAHHEHTLKRAEDVIADTASNRRAFLARAFADAGIPHDR